jgi:hypothetical protein
MPKDLPFPVKVARQIADLYGKDIVIIFGANHATGMTHTATYGRSPQDKITAAELGPIVAKACGTDVSQSTSFEDFRTNANLTADLEKARARIDDLILALQGVTGATSPEETDNLILGLQMMPDSPDKEAAMRAVTTLKRIHDEIVAESAEKAPA